MEWFGVFQRSELERDKGAGGGWQPEEWRARAINDDAPEVIRLFALQRDGVSVAVAGAHVTRDENLHSLRIDIHVEPSERRQGYGTQVLSHMEEVAKELGRSEVFFHVIEGAEEVAVAPNRFFAPGTGCQLIDELARRDLMWPVSLDELQRQLDAVAPLAQGYDLHVWQGSAPDWIVPSLISLMARMGVESNFADIDVDVAKFDEARLRHYEGMVRDMGRDLLVTAATDRATGEVAGYTELTVSRNDPATAYQWDTLVARVHRGHRLGMVLKLRNLQEFARAGYVTRRISTFNSVHNTPMIDVNEALGARLAGAMVTWRKKLV